jgi:hypothetical protein
MGAVQADENDPLLLGESFLLATHRTLSVTVDVERGIEGEKKSRR